MEILVLCTGNICRSPMAAGLLGDKLADLDGEIVIRSAGLVLDGKPASENGVLAMRDRGITIDDHRSRIMTRDDVASADLILAMERRHLREAVVLEPSRFARAFTLKELVRRIEVVGGRRPDESVDAWLGRVGAGRRPADLMGDAPGDDVADPIGRSRKEYERTAAELDELLTVVVEALFPALASTH